MVPKCPYCGALEEMTWNAGYLVWMCPQERVGLGNHPRQFTSNSTGPDLTVREYIIPDLCNPDTK